MTMQHDAATHRPMLRAAILLAALASTSACTSFSSRIDDANAPKEGLSYWLPTRGVSVTYKLVGCKASVTIASSTPIPDLTQRFVLQHRNTPLGASEMDITIKTNGLLESAKSIQSGSFGDLLKEIAEAAGTLKVRFAAAPPCATADGEWTRFITPLELDTLGKPIPWTIPSAPPTPATITIDALYPGALDDADVPRAKRSDRNHPGVFYRQERPFRVVFSDRSAEWASFVALPNHSPVEFLPIRRAFFASATATLSFTDGMPTGYKQVGNSEVIGLFSIPAEVLKSYFGAIGEAFKHRKGSAEAEQQYLDAIAKLMASQAKHERCVNAVSANDQAAITEHCK